MENPARIDLKADRWVACIRYLSFISIDLTGATFAAQIRQVPDGTGSPLVNLGTTTNSSAEGIKLFYAGTDTIANHIAAGHLEELPDNINKATGQKYALTDTVALSWVRIRVNETTMESLPFPLERGDDIEFVWDMHITPSGGEKDKYAGGKLLVRAGATE
jgi:hypothetical protein